MDKRYKFFRIFLLVTILLFLNSCSKPTQQRREVPEEECRYNIAEFVLNKKTQSDSTGFINGYEWVDLGLSVKWATCNVGANSPEEFGNYYAWGEIATKDTFTNENYICSRYKLYKCGIDTLLCISGLQDLDAATANWGGSWRIPTRQEWEELLLLCDWEYSFKRDGYVVKSKKNSNSIFLPTAGFSGDKWCRIGFYWTSTLYGGVRDSSSYAIVLDDLDYNIGGVDLNENDYIPNGYLRYEGQSIRPVTE